MTDNAYEAGRRAFFEGYCISENPWRDTGPSDVADDWGQGWIDAEWDEYEADDLDDYYDDEPEDENE